MNYTEQGYTQEDGSCTWWYCRIMFQAYLALMSLVIWNSYDIELNVKFTVVIKSGNVFPTKYCICFLFKTYDANTTMCVLFTWEKKRHTGFSMIKPYECFQDWHFRGKMLCVHCSPYFKTEIFKNLIISMYNIHFYMYKKIIEALTSM